MGKKSNKKVEEKSKSIYKTVELKNFINVLKEVDKDVSDDLNNKPVKKTKEKKVNKADVINIDDNGKSTQENNAPYQIVDEPSKIEKKSKGIYFGFFGRFLVNLLLLIIAIVIFSYSLLMSIGLTREEVIDYKVSSNIDYKVYLKPNDFYDTPYLGKGMAYVSSLIDKINVNYNYRFNVSRKSNIDFDYKVIARLVIANKSNSNIFFDKEYKLADLKTEKMENGTIHLIDKETSVNYSYYNNLANKFRSKYAVDTNSYLEVYLLVNEKNSENNDYKLNNNSKAILTIPLSMQEINISLNEADINENNHVLANSKLVVKDTRNVIISAILLVIVFVLIIRFIKKILLLTSRRSIYDVYVNKILRGYDRIIVNIKSVPNFKKYNVIKVESFQELVDVRDNFKSPINYYVVSDHQKSEFFVVNNNDVYKYVVKAVDLEKGKTNEKK